MNMQKPWVALFVIFSITLSGCLQPSKSLGDGETAFEGGTEFTSPEDKIAVPTIDLDPDVVGNGASRSEISSSAVNGGWSPQGDPWWANVSNNTQYVTKFCTQPRPLNGGADCVKESSWQHGVKDGVQYAYKATSICRNGFIWNGSECSAPLGIQCPNGTALINGSCSLYVDLTSYWPTPKGEELISKYFIYDDEHGKDRYHQVQYHQVGTEAIWGPHYTMSTMMGPSLDKLTRADIWFYKITNGQVLEFRDIVFQSLEDYTYTTDIKDNVVTNPGYEIKWGGKQVKKGDVIEGSLGYTNGIAGYNHLTVLEIYPKRTVRGKTYENVVFVSLIQTFPAETFYAQYTLAPKIGFLESWVWSSKYQKNSVHFLTHWCTRPTPNGQDTCY